MYLSRCRDEHLNRESSLQNPETLPRLLGFAMFEAELFCNYRVSTCLSDNTLLTGSYIMMQPVSNYVHNLIFIL